MSVEIVVDAMGSDQAPESEIRGAILAARAFDVSLTLVGPEETLAPKLATALKGEKLKIQIAPATEWITMTDKAAAAVRSKATPACAWG